MNFVRLERKTVFFTLMMGSKSVLKLLFLLMGVALSHSLSGQYTSDNGLFFVDQVRGCPGLTVTITNNNPVCDCIICACNFDYNGDGMYTVQPDKYVYTYDMPGTYRLEILFSGTSDFITITIEDKPAPDFTVQRCGGNGAKVIVNDANYDSYEIDWGDGSMPVVVPNSAPEAEYAFVSANTYTIRVRGLDMNSANNCAVSSQAFSASDMLNPPAITGVTVLDETEVEIAYLPGDENTLYNLTMSTDGGPFQQINQIYSPNTLPSIEPVTGLDLENNFYCFRLEAFDPCTLDVISSPTDGCTIQLTASNQSGSNRLEWDGTDPDTSFEIYRDGVLLVTLPASDRSYDDTDFVCGQTYCYQIRGISAIPMFSIESCIQANSTIPPPRITELAIQPQGADLALSWNYMPTSNVVFDVYRYIDGGGANIIGTANMSSFLDEDIVDPTVFSYCYEIVPRDPCGNANPDNAIACAFTPIATIDIRDQVSVSWPPYEGFLNGIATYEIQKSYDGMNFTNVNQISDTVFIETDSQGQNQSIYYRVAVLPSALSNLVAYSYTAMVSKNNLLVFPDAFTPDGDGLNDTLDISGRFINTFEMDIFNRWGELIYHSDQIDRSWDGTYRGKNAPQDTYILQVRVTDEVGTESTYEGSIVLLRR